MADDDKETEAKAAGSPAQSAQIQIVGQYIKDLSFENPSVGKPIQKSDESPNLEVQINVSANRLKEELFESAIELKVVASISEGTIYDLELIYGGMFRARNIEDQALEAFLLIHCPTLLFPFARRVVADLTREGGFPPLMLDPIDFTALYQMNKKRNEGQKPILN